MSEIDKRQNETLVAPDGTELRRGDYLPTSYTGGIQVCLCDSCESGGIFPSDEYLKCRHNPYERRCGECNAVSTFTRI